MSSTPQSQLAVLVHADIVGSTRLARLNEGLAHQRILSAFHQFARTIAMHNGVAREIRGDALVAEFSKASDAVCASLAFQAANGSHNDELSDEFQPELRIGIAMGEVVVSDDIVTGEGIVLAQRLEQLAHPGGVCIQEAAYQTLPKRLPLEFDALGAQQLKGFDEPVTSYAVKLQAGESLPKPAVAAPQTAVNSDLSGRPSVAVLPFDCMSSDPEQEFFSDGICEDILTALSRYKELFVIARGSSFQFKNQSVDVAEAASTLGCEYVLEGSVRKAGQRVRITAQLIEGATGGHVWAEKYDRTLEDIFAVQDDVVSTIVSTLVGRVEEDSRKRAAMKSPDSLTAYEHVLRGRYYWPDMRGSVDDWHRAREEFNKAIELDPNCAPAYAGLAVSYLYDYYYATPEEREFIAKKNYECACKAVELDDTNAQAHLQLAYSYIDVKGDIELGRIQLERAVELNPNDYYNSCAKISVSIRSGDYDESITCAHEATRLNPFLPDFCLAECGFAQFFAAKYEDAIKTFGKILAPDVKIRGGLAACYAHLGRHEQARIAADTCREQAEQDLGSNWTTDTWEKYWDASVYGYFAQGKEPNERLRRGLQQAGLP